MKIKKGTDRIVVAFPLLGIVVKIPIIHFIRLFSVLTTEKGEFPLYWKYWKMKIFSGLISNWNEFRFYWRTRNPFLQPTYFSIFGLLNIQRYGEPCNLQIVDLWCQLHELTDGSVFDDSHHFANPNNFCFYKGKLRISDYGSQRSHRVIMKYGERIFKFFDPAYSWKGKRKGHIM